MAGASIRRPHPRHPPGGLADGAATRHDRRTGSGDGAEPRATFVRLSNEMFPDRAIVTMAGEDVSGLTCRSATSGLATWAALK